jgi:hypothetical protein
MIGDIEIEATRSGDVDTSINEGDEVKVGFPADRIWVVARG